MTDFEFEIAENMGILHCKNCENYAKIFYMSSTNKEYGFCHKVASEYRDALVCSSSNCQGMLDAFEPIENAQILIEEAIENSFNY